MTEYGVMINGQLIRHKSYHERDKQIVNSDIPTTDYVCVHHWEERENTIVQVWTVTDIAAEHAAAEATEHDFLQALEEVGVIDSE